MHIVFIPKFYQNVLAKKFWPFFVAKNFSTMLRVLNVAEKNDVAKNVANILSRGTAKKREGYSVYNKLYDFKYFVPALHGSCDMVMTSVCGHLMNYDFLAQYTKWNSCDPKVLFSAPIQPTFVELAKKIKLTLQREIKKCNYLIIWTDCDREGENIGFEIITVCKEVNANIQVYRAHFSEITNHAINRAIENLARPDKKISGIFRIFFHNNEIFIFFTFLRCSRYSTTVRLTYWRRIYSFSNDAITKNSSR